MSKSLYERLGGAQGIAKIVDDVVAGHLANPLVQTRFQNVEDLQHLKQMACEFFAAGSGGPEKYTGKDMRAAHKGMNISEQEFVAVLDDILAAMDKNKLGDQEKREVLAIAYSLKAEVIRV